MKISSQLDSDSASNGVAKQSQPVRLPKSIKYLITEKPYFLKQGFFVALPNWRCLSLKKSQISRVYTHTPQNHP